MLTDVLAAIAFGLPVFVGGILTERYVLKVRWRDGLG